MQTLHFWLVYFYMCALSFQKAYITQKKKNIGILHSVCWGIG